MCETKRVTEFKSNPKVAEVGPHKFKKGVDSATISQETNTKYLGNGDNLLEETVLGEYPGKRNIWMDVKKGTTVKEAQKLYDAKFPKARLVRILGDEVEDVMSRGQLWAMANPDAEIISDAKAVSKEAFADRLEIKDQEGNPVAYNGDRQFGANFLDITGELDPVIDLRGLDSEAKLAARKLCAI